MGKLVNVGSRIWQWCWLAAGVWLMAWSVPQLLTLDTGGLTGWEMAALSTQGLVNLRAADWAWTAKLSLQNNFTIAVADELLRTTMPRLLHYLWLAAAGSSLLHLLGVVCSAALRGPAGWVQRAGVLAARLLAGAAVCYAATAMLLVATVPLSSLHQPLQGLLRSELPEGVGQQVLDLHAATQKYSVTSGYGLFRRMTGVGPSTALPPGEEGWGGLPAQNVAVPAIVLEGTADGKNWAEIPFR